MVSIEFGRSPLLGKHTDALPVPPASIVRQREKEREKWGRGKRSRAAEKIATGRGNESSVRNSILVKRGYKAETGVNSDRRNRYLFNARRRKGGDRRRKSERDGRRRLEREKFSMGLREGAFHSAHREEIKREMYREDRCEF